MSKVQKVLALKLHRCRLLVLVRQGAIPACGAAAEAHGVEEDPGGALHRPVRVCARARVNLKSCKTGSTSNMITVRLAPTARRPTRCRNLAPPIIAGDTNLSIRRRHPNCSGMKSISNPAKQQKLFLTASGTSHYKESYLLDVRVPRPSFTPRRNVV